VPTINQVLDRFLEEHATGGDRFGVESYKETVVLLQTSLESYGHASLFHEDDLRLLEAGTEDGADDFCSIFGPDKLLDHYYEFLYTYLVSKVLPRPGLRATVASISGDLAAWLGALGFVAARLAADASEIARAAAEVLPRAEVLGTRLYESMQAHRPVGLELLDRNDIYESFATITRIEPGELWFDDRGPVAVGNAASDAAEIGWEVNVVLGRCPEGWCLLELGFVYPA
jgi:hypothetical protein